MEQEFNFESIKNKALEQLKSGKSLLGYIFRSIPVHFPAAYKA